jgi:AraC family transcriptional regulator
MRITYRETPPATVFCARGYGPYASSSRAAWRTLEAWLDQNDARKRARFGFGVCRDNPRVTPPELIRYDACVPAAPFAELELVAGIERQVLPGGAWAVHVHVGGYDTAGDVISRLQREIVPARGLTVDYDRPVMAVYLNDPRFMRQVHRRTDLYIPVVPIPAALVKDEDDAARYDISAIARRLAS